MISRCALYHFLVLFVLHMHFSKPISSARILGFFSSPCRSHIIIYESLMKELARRNHNVTVVTTFPQVDKAIRNYRYIQVSTVENVENDKAQEMMLKGAEKGESFFKQLPKVLRGTTGRTSEMLKSSVMENLKQETFDLIIFGHFINDFQIGLAHQFNCPTVMISVMPVSHLKGYVGNPVEIASVPNLFLGTHYSMTFLHRTKNFLAYVLEMVIVNALDYFLMESLYTQHFPPEKFPSYSESKKNVSLILVNQHFSQGTPQALVPALQEFSGMHIKRKPDPLPENIQQWLDSATDGAIIFSMGSNVKSSEISIEKRDAILRTFATLKQNILWKFEHDNLPNKPENVMISKWFPQEDVFAHPNVVLFITHCGKGGLSEARYHGVPILGIPIYGDQRSNLNIAVQEGWAVGLEYSDVDEITFSKALSEALSNRKYREVVKQLSVKFRDRPQHPLDNAAFWVEYVIRHNGAKHLQSPAVHLNFFQYHSLDVIALLFIIVYLSIKVSKFVLTFIYRKLCGKSKNVQYLKNKPNRKRE